MAGRDMLMQVVVKLRDELSRGIDGAMKKLIALGNLAKRISTASVAALNAIGTKLGMLGIGAGGGLMAGLQSFVKFDAGLRDIAITAGLTDKAVGEFVKSSGAKIEGLAKKTGQLSSKLVESHQIMTAANVETPAAQTMLGPIGKASTAAAADIGDITKTAIASFQNAGIKPEQLETALAHMITGGKLGSFELKDMAQHYPQVLASLANIGVKGMGGVDTATAMLQISKRTAGTTGEAATNMLDFLSGINSDHTRKRFEKHGVDLPAVMADANARGINPVEAVIQKIGKIIDQPKVVDEAMKRAKAKGLDPTKTQEEVRKSVDQAVRAAGLGELFVNQQSKMFLMAMLANLEDYKKMKAEIGGAGNKVIDEDFQSRMEGPEAKQRMAGEALEQLGRRLGSALQGVFDSVGWAAQKIQDFVSALDQISPKIVDLATQIGALVSAIAGATFLFQMFGGAAPAAATAGAGVAGAAAGAAGAGGAGGLIGRLLGAARVGTGLGLGAFAAWKTWQGLDAIGEAAGSKNWMPKAPDEMADLRARLKATEATIAKLRTNSRDPDSLGPVLAPHEARAADLRGRIAAGERAGVERPLQPLPRPSVQAPPQKVEIGGNITVKVDGPGKVTSASSSTPGVTIGGGGDRGSNGSRP